MRTSSAKLLMALLSAALLVGPGCDRSSGDRAGGGNGVAAAGGAGGDEAGHDGSEKGGATAGGGDAPQVEAVTGFQDPVGGLESDARAVYLLEGGGRDNGRVLRIGIRDGAVTVLAAHAAGHGLTSDADRLYWVARTGRGVYDGVRSVSKSGGPVGTLVSGLKWAGATPDIATDGASVFVVGLGGGGVTAVPVKGGPTTHFALRVPDKGLTVVAVDDTHVYAASGQASLTIYRAPKAGGTLKKLVAREDIHLVSATSPEMVVTGGRLYWTNGYHNQHGGGVVTAMPVAGGKIQELAIRQGMPADLVLSGGDVFWTNLGSSFGADGEVMRLRAGATKPQVLASDRRTPAYLQVAGGYVYFTAGDPKEKKRGVLYRIPR